MEVKQKQSVSQLPIKKGDKQEVIFFLEDKNSQFIREWASTWAQLPVWFQSELIVWSQFGLFPKHFLFGAFIFEHELFKFWIQKIFITEYLSIFPKLKWTCKKEKGH